jgi:hypothetical protein
MALKPAAKFDSVKEPSGAGAPAEKHTPMMVHYRRMI